MHGFGTYVWKTGQRYDGEWKVRDSLSWCVNSLRLPLFLDTNTNQADATPAHSNAADDVMPSWLALLAAVDNHHAAVEPSGACSSIAASTCPC
jgi:hypothetical protein